jgi:MYXO-CTERM domain-containing protein
VGNLEDKPAQADTSTKVSANAGSGVDGGATDAALATGGSSGGGGTVGAGGAGGSVAGDVPGVGGNAGSAGSGGVLGTGGAFIDGAVGVGGSAGSSGTGGTGGVQGSTAFDGGTVDSPRGIDSAASDIPVKMDGGQAARLDGGATIEAGAAGVSADAATMAALDAARGLDGGQPVAKKDSGCGCSIGDKQQSSPSSLPWAMALLLLAALLRRRAR